MASGIFRYSKDKIHYMDCPYEGTPIDINASDTKDIYRIRFTGQVPEGGPFYRGVDYCLKVVTVCGTRGALPANRDYWDAAGFQGDHLMHAIALDETGDLIAGQLRQTGHIDAAFADSRFMILEPDGTSLADLIDSSRAPDTGMIGESVLPVRRRLDYLYQICQGLEELYSQVPRDGRRVVSYRDLKEENVLIFFRPDGDLVQLIDFATIRLEDSAGFSSSGTYRTHFSESNTAPEDVLAPGDPAVPTYTGGTQDEKTDVFALGMILGTLFTNCRPLRRWIRKCAMETANQENLWVNSYARVIKGYGYRDYHWLENELEGILRWDPAMTDTALSRLQRLFRQATSLWPDRRPSLATFMERVEELIQLLPRDPEGSGEEEGYWFTVFIENTSCGPEMVPAYREAAEEILRDQTRQLADNGVEDPAVYAAIIRYRDETARTPDAVTSPAMVYREDSFLEKILPDFERTPVIPGAAGGLTEAVRALQNFCRLKNPRFTGSVFILTPGIPPEEALEKARFFEVLDDCLRITVDSCRFPLNVTVCASSSPYLDWCDTRLLPAGAAPAAPVPAPAPVPVPAPEKPARKDPVPDASEDTDPLRLEDGIYVGAGAIYVLDEGGVPVYVMKMKS